MLILTNNGRIDGAKIICNFADQMCPHKIAQYPIRHAEVFALAHRYLDEWNRGVLLDPRNILAFAMLGQELVAAVSCVPKTDESGLHLFAKGLISTGQAPSIAAPMIAGAMRYAMATSSLPISAEAIVREIDGVPNVGSARAFTKNGFNTVLRSRGQLELVGSHLMVSEPQMLNSIAIHRLFAPEKDLKEHGDWVLRAWKEA